MTNIAIVGEAWGEQEERARMPFVGSAGYELTRMLDEAGIRRADCFLTNVFNMRPVNNDIETFCTSINGDRLQNYPPLRAGKYIRREFQQELDRLYAELAGVSPNLVVALGNTASWAILRNSGISKIRGAVASSSIIGGRTFKTIPTYHPAAILRQWDLRPVTVLDLTKAQRESKFPDIRLPKRTVYVEPELSDLEWFYDRHILPAQILSVDIETMADQITCIGFAPTVDIALVVPFVDNRRGGSYWRSESEELRVWDFVQRVCECSIPKLFQNGIYDMHFLYRRYGIRTINATHDTMLLHHALLPESEKGLGFLGSVYTNEASWKLMRKGSETIKRDE